jgi:hypothetical protein
VNALECSREHDVLDAAVRGRWPDELRSHADVCSTCGDLAVVVEALRRDHEDASQDARVPTAGQVWWRATMRRRAEAAAAAARPITLVQGLAGSCAAGLFGAFVTLSWPALLNPIAGFGAALLRQRERLGDVASALATTPQGLLAVGLVLGAGMILPFVVYVALREE